MIRVRQQRVSPRWLILLAALCVTACEPRSSAWETAQAEDSIAAYQAFIERYQDGEFVAEARGRLRELQAEEAWARVLSDDSVDGYRAFIAEHGESSLAADATALLDAAFAGAWQAADEANTSAAYQDFLALNPPESFAGEAEWWLELLGRVQGSDAMQSVAAELIQFSPAAESDVVTIEFPGPVTLGRSELPAGAVLRLTMHPSQVPHWPAQFAPGDRVRMFFGAGQYTGEYEVTGGAIEGLLRDPDFGMMTAVFKVRAQAQSWSREGEPLTSDEPVWILEQEPGIGANFVPVAIRLVRARAE